MMKIIECPRDAMQGLTSFIKTEDKISYINQLLKVGFNTIDFGSFVSPKAIPQMRDTADVIRNLDLRNKKSELLAIVVNERGADEALTHLEIDFLGFPLSISETFQKRNSNQSISKGFEVLQAIARKVESANRKLVVYVSMGFGNPYGDAYDENLIFDFIDKIIQNGSDVISVSDTVGSSSVDQIVSLFPSILEKFTSVEIGAHLHSVPNEQSGKVKALLQSGVKRIDGAMLGYGGCPMASDDLTGNINTEEIMKLIDPGSVGIDMDQFRKSKEMATKIFSTS